MLPGARLSWRIWRVLGHSMLVGHCRHALGRDSLWDGSRCTCWGVRLRGNLYSKILSGRSGSGEQNVKHSEVRQDTHESANSL